MKITVKLFATLKRYLPDGAQGSVCSLSIAADTTVQNIIEMLAIPADIPKIILINGLKRNSDDVLSDGDTLCVFPPIAGG